MEIRPLRPADNRRNFRSGDITHDEFFQKYAGHPSLGVTCVAVQGRRILGFASFIGAELVLPDRTLKVVRLARLAVDRSVRGQGVAGKLLQFVMWLTVQTGRAGICADAQTSFFERFGFVPVELESGFLGLRPVPKTMFLPAETMRKAHELATAADPSEAA